MNTGLTESFRCRPHTITMTRADCGKRHLSVVQGSRFKSDECRYCEVGRDHAIGVCPSVWPDGKELLAVDPPVFIAPPAATSRFPPNRSNVPKTSSLPVALQNALRVQSQPRPVVTPPAVRLLGEPHPKAKLYEYDGRALSLAQWAVALNVSTETLRQRLRRWKDYALVFGTSRVGVREARGVGTANRAPAIVRIEQAPTQPPETDYAEHMERGNEPYVPASREDARTDQLAALNALARDVDKAHRAVLAPLPGEQWIKEIVPVDVDSFDETEPSTALAHFRSGLHAAAFEPGTPRVPLIEHVFQLRRDLRITFSLPEDLTTADVARLEFWLNSLPFEDAQ